jgi:flagellar biosynthesis/type III secretory pathway chaperone
MVRSDTTQQAPVGPDDPVLSLAQRLAHVLETEFESLRTQRVEAFEALQPEKEALLLELKRLADGREGSAGAAAWPEPARALLLRCRDAHLRNECLVRHHLVVIRGTLDALSSSGQSRVDTYDRSGRIGRVGSSFSDDRA